MLSLIYSQIDEAIKQIEQIKRLSGMEGNANGFPRLFLWPQLMAGYCYKCNTYVQVQRAPLS